MGLDIKKFTLVDGDEYVSKLHRVIFFRRTDSRMTSVRKYIQNQNEKYYLARNKKLFTFKYCFKTKLITVICTIKHKQN